MGSSASVLEEGVRVPLPLPSARKRNTEIQDGALMSSSLLLRNSDRGIVDTLIHFFAALRVEVEHFAKVDAGICKEGGKGRREELLGRWRAGGGTTVSS